MTPEVIAGLNGASYNYDMEILGRVDNGVVVPQSDATLPEGALVRIVYEPEVVEAMKNPGHRVKLPLVESDNPGTLHLTNKMIAEIFDDEDAIRR